MWPGDNELAKDLYSQGISGCPKDNVGLLGTLYSNRSMCHLQLNDVELALKDAKQTILLRPEWPRGYLRKALALFCKGDGDGALDCVNDGLEIDPKDEALKALAESIVGHSEMQKQKEQEEGMIKDATDMLESAGILQIDSSIIS